MSNQPPGPEEGITQHTCQQEGCSLPGIPCDVPGDVGYPFNSPPRYVYYCTNHCFENGYCYGCGQYRAGVASFDFSLSHLCPNCEAEPASL